MARMQVTALIVLTLALAAGATAQTTTPYAGVIDGDDVFVRSGPGQNYYPVMKLSRGAAVTVVGRQGAYLKVTPPKKVFSLVSKQYVDADGAAGKVTRDRVIIRAGSFERPTEKSSRQGYLKKGQAVTIVGQTDEYYKVVPPAHVVVYISEAYVKPAGAATTTKPAASPTTRPTSRPAAAPATPTEVDKLRQAVDAFKAAEEALMAEYKKPADQRDLAKLLALYNALQTPADSPLARKVGYRLRYLKRALRRREGKAEVLRLAAEDKEQRVALNAEGLKIAAIDASLTRPRPFRVRGRLTPSQLYLGDGVAPRRYLVTDTATGAAVAYAQQGAGAVDLASLAGCCVELVGKRIYSSALRVYIVEVASAKKIAEPAPAVVGEQVEMELTTFPKPWRKPAVVTKTVVEAAEPADSKPADAESADAEPTPTTGLPMTPATEATTGKVDPAEYK